MTQRKLPNLQILRATAGMMIVIFHLSHAIKTAGIPMHQKVSLWILQVMPFRVDVFFVLSGFVLAYSAARAFSESQKASYFLARRLVRIFPLLWVTLLFAILLWASGYAFRTISMTPTYILGSFFCYPMDRLPIIPQAWTLSYEVYYFSLFAFGLLCFRSVSFLVLGLCAWLICWVLIGMAGNWRIVSAFMASPILIEMLMGSIIGVLYAKERMRPSISVGVFLLSASFFLLWVTIQSGFCYRGSPWEIRAWLWGIPSALLVSGLLVLPQARSMRLKPIIILGDASYSVYLSHGFVALAVARFGSSNWVKNLGGEFVLILSTCLAASVGYVYWRFLEKPINSFCQAKVRQAFD